MGSAFVKYPGRTLDHFYDAQGINHSVMAVSTQHIDANGDDSANQIYTYTYAPTTIGNQTVW